MSKEINYKQTSRTLKAMVRAAVALPSSDAAKLPATGLAGDTPVTVKCYNKEERWNSRYLAYHYYLAGALECAGSCEGDRYWNIAARLRYYGGDWVSDGDDYYDRMPAA